LMVHLYPELGKPVPKSMHTYDDHCDFGWENIYDNLDHYFLQHLTGWFFGSFIFRDALMLHTVSILHEILELTWQHILPHFRECWWDHVLIDVLLSNTPAIIFGLWFQRYMNVKQYDFMGRKGKKSIFDWEIWRCHRRFGQVLCIFLVSITNFLAGFFLINVLWIPPKNYLNVYRLSIVYLGGILAYGEAYRDIESWGTPARATNPVTAEFRWLAFAGGIVEVFICWKFRNDAGNMLDNETPIYIWLPWTILIITSIAYYLYLRFKPGHTTKLGDSIAEQKAAVSTKKNN